MSTKAKAWAAAVGAIITVVLQIMGLVEPAFPASWKAGLQIGTGILTVIAVYVIPNVPSIVDQVADAATKYQANQFPELVVAVRDAVIKDAPIIGQAARAGAEAVTGRASVSKYNIEQQPSYPVPTPPASVHEAWNTAETVGKHAADTIESATRSVPYVGPAVAETADQFVDRMFRGGR